MNDLSPSNLPRPATTESPVAFPQPPTGIFLATSSSLHPRYLSTARALIDAAHPHDPALNAARFIRSHHRSYLYEATPGSRTITPDARLVAVAVCTVTRPGGLYAPYDLVPACELGLLSVDPAFRGRGFARMLVDVHLVHTAVTGLAAVAAPRTTHSPPTLFVDWTHLDTVWVPDVNSDVDLFTLSL